MADLQEKRARLEAIEVQSKRRRKLVLISLCTLLVVGIVAVVLSTKEAIPGFDDKYSIGNSVDYENKTIEMTEVKLEISNGQVKLSLADLKKYNIIYAMYDPNFNIGNNQKGLPVMAYLTPAGRVMVASSFCEPCYSRKFHIVGDVLVCNVCFTRWALADLTGLGGGCVKYPPQEFDYTVDEDNGDIIIKEDDIKNWTPRDYDSTTTKDMITS